MVSFSFSSSFFFLSHPTTLGQKVPVHRVGGLTGKLTCPCGATYHRRREMRSHASSHPSSPVPRHRAFVRDEDELPEEEGGSPPPPSPPPPFVVDKGKGKHQPQQLCDHDPVDDDGDDDIVLSFFPRGRKTDDAAVAPPMPVTPPPLASTSKQPGLTTRSGLNYPPVPPPTTTFLPLPVVPLKTTLQNKQTLLALEALEAGLACPM